MNFARGQILILSEFVIVFEIIVDSVLEHISGSFKTCVFDLCAGNIEVSATLQSFENELNVDLTL